MLIRRRKINGRALALNCCVCISPAATQPELNGDTPTPLFGAKNALRTLFAVSATTTLYIWPHKWCNCEH